MKYLAILSFFSFLTLTTNAFAGDCGKYVITDAYSEMAAKAKLSTASLDLNSLKSEQLEALDFNQLPATAAGASGYTLYEVNPSWSWD